MVAGAVVVVGAGPSGLRAAIELRLLGAQVTLYRRGIATSRDQYAQMEIGFNIFIFL